MLSVIIEAVELKRTSNKLGNRSALEWVPDQYKERKPKDPTIAEKFNTYRFADYKDHVIDLLKRVCSVSFETREMDALDYREKTINTNFSF